MARLLNVANINLDVVIEIPGPLVGGAHHRGRLRPPRLGGGGPNTALGLAWAGHEVALAAFVGSDPAADDMLAQLAGHGIDLARVVRLPGDSPRAFILLEADGERTIISTGDTRDRDLPPQALAGRFDAVYVKSVRPGLAPMMRARLDSGLVIAQLPPATVTDWPAHVLIASAADLDPARRAAPFAAGRRIAGDALRWVVVTDGARGATAYGADATVQVPAVPTRVVDTTGAGDVFAAGLIHGLVTGRAIGACLGLGAEWAALAVAAPSSVPPPALKALLAAQRAMT